MTVTSKLKRLTKKLSAVPQIVCPLDKNRKKLKGQFGAWLLDDLFLGGSILQLTLTTLHLQKWRWETTGSLAKSVPKSNVEH